MTSIKKPTAEELKEILAQHSLYLCTRFSEKTEGKCADLRSADLRSADLRSADLRSADLGGADLGDIKTDKSTVMHPACTLPEEGSFIAWKKVSDSAGKGIVLKLEIFGKRVSSYIGRKCRADTVRVIAAFGPMGGERTGQFHSLHDHKFVYEVGCVVSVPDYDDSPLIECTRGIHFYMTRAEAEAH